MIVDDYDSDDLEGIRGVCQELFHSNYITEYVFAPNESMKKANPSYSFIMKHYPAIEELLECCGWKLRHDEQVRVLYLTSDFTSARAVLSQTESYFLLALRLIYDEMKIRASATGEVFITVRHIMEQLTALGTIDSIPKHEREKALRTLASKNIISRMTGKWGDLDARIAVLPSIICAISPDKIKSVLEMLSLDKMGEDTDADSDSNIDLDGDDEEEEEGL